MTLILVLICTVVWAIVAVRIARFLTKGLRGSRWYVSAFIGLFVVVMALPLLDEIVGGWQFRRLCEKSVIHIDRENATGARVVVEIQPQIPVPWMWLPVRRQSFNFVDVKTGRPLVSYDVFYAEGGRLMPSFDSGSEPITFRGVCAPGDRVRIDNGELIRQLGMVRVDDIQGK